MKILHINSNYIYTALHQTMIEHLDKVGVVNHIYAPVISAAESVITPNANVVVSECFQKWDRYVFSYKQKKIYADLVKRFDLTQFDCVHAYTLFTDGYCAYKINKRYGIPYVVAVRNTDVNTFFKKRFYLRKIGLEVMRKASAILFLSQSTCNKVFDKYVPAKDSDQLREKVKIIPNGIDDFWLKNLFKAERNPIQDKNINLVYAGRIDKNKNIPMVQKAMEIMNDRGYHTRLTIAGKIKDKKEFDTIARNEFTEYIGVLDKEHLIDVYRKNDVFIMVSHVETFGLVYAESMSQGLPVVYTKGQGFDRQFEDGTIGYSVSDTDPISIANAIEQIINHYSDIARRCISCVKKFDWSYIADLYKELYQNIGKD